VAAGAARTDDKEITMRTTVRLFAALLGLVMALALAGCGPTPVTIADLPVYPDAVELKPGESAVGDVLAQNMQQDAAVREAAGTGGSTEQRGFSLPAGATWDDVKGFYTTELKAAGWEEGMGGPGGDLAGQIMAQASQGNDLFQTTLFSRGDQVLSVIRVANPVDPSQVELVLSLSTR
jgi:hypothetical protein